MNGFAVIRKHFIFTGRVQGVGFRFRAKHAASGLGLTGWVKNRWNGSVEMEIQGTEDKINEMLKQINQSPYIRIDWIEQEEIYVDPHDTGFHVR
ncbi:MAG: acylphosphatase [Lachnospiraceae bacterium]|nr:acylphosphatase [Lachnospiraceae bacterium]